MPSVAAVAAVTRAWFDCTPPAVISVSAPRATASAPTSRIFRTLLPPNANGIASSRLTSSRGPPPSARRKRESSSTGVTYGASGSDGRVATPDMKRSVYWSDWLLSSKPCNRDHRSLRRNYGPPRAELEASASMDAWIDTYHAVRGLTREGTFVFLTDSAVGMKEEDNLRHLVSNIGADVPRSAIVPFLTCKHPLDYCLAYADRAAQHGFQALVVLGGDTSVGPAPLRGARVGAPGADSRAPTGPRPRRLGQPSW